MAVRWYGEAAKVKVKTGMVSRLEKASRYAKNEIRRELSVAAKRGESAKKKITRGKNKGKPRLLKGKVGSPPGSYPFLRTGFLRSNINSFVDVAKLQAFVGAAMAAFYARYLEFGTKKMKARPWLYRTLLTRRPQIMRLLRRGKL